MALHLAGLKEEAKTQLARFQGNLSFKMKWLKINYGLPLPKDDSEVQEDHDQHLLNAIPSFKRSDDSWLASTFLSPDKKQAVVILPYVQFIDSKPSGLLNSLVEETIKQVYGVETVAFVSKSLPMNNEQLISSLISQGITITAK